MASVEGSSRFATDSIQLVRRYRDGDQEALGLLVERYYDRVRRVVRLRISREMLQVLEVDDIVQETFETAIRKFDQFEVREDASILNWFAKLAENEIRDAYKYHHREKRDRRKQVRITSPTTEVGGGIAWDQLVAEVTPTPLRVARDEIHEIVDDCLRDLSEEHREAIVLRDLEEGSWEFVRGELKRPTVAAAQELHRRAKLKLARKLVVRTGESGHA